MNLIAQLEADLFRMKIPFVHLTATHRQAIQAERRFAALLDKELTADDRYRYKFFDARICGASCEHVPILILEDKASMNQAALPEAMMIPAPCDDVQPLVIEVLPT